MFNRIIKFIKKLFGRTATVPAQIPPVVVAPSLPQGGSTTSEFKLKVKIIDTSGFSASDLTKIALAQDIIELVVNSIAYREEFLKAEFTETNGKSNIEILNTILSGDCQFTDADGTMDLKLVMYGKRFSKVVGYTDGTPFTVFINRKFFSTPLSIGSNLFHEYIHLSGWSHHGAFETSVPYLAGNTIFERVAKRLGVK